MIRDDQSQPLAVRREASESINTLQSLIPPNGVNAAQTAPPPASVQPTPAGTQQVMLVSRPDAGQIMNETSAAELAATNDTVRTQLNKVDDLVSQTLDGIAGGIRQHLNDYARIISDQQLDVTTDLGKHGITRLRDDLDKAAAALEDELRRAATQINWRDQPSAIALFKFLEGRVGRFDAILEGRGYQIASDRKLSPYSLFDRESLDGLERELVRPLRSGERGRLRGSGRCRGQDRHAMGRRHRHGLTHQSSSDIDVPDDLISHGALSREDCGRSHLNSQRIPDSTASRFGRG